MAYLACETGIAPAVLLEESEEMIDAMLQYLRRKYEAMRRK